MKKNILAILVFLLITAGLTAHPAWGIVVDIQGNIYFADIGHNGRGSVWKLHKSGELELLLSDFHAHNVSLDENENLITAHGEDHHTMIRLKANGTKDTLYHTLDLKEFFGGNCTFSKNGDILFSIDKYLWRINSNGKKEKFSEQKLEWNQVVFVDETGTAYVPDIGIDNGVVYKIEPDGSSTQIATDLISKLDRPKDKHNDVLLGMTKGPEGSIYICENAGGRVVKISEKGRAETFYTSTDGWFPSGLVFVESVAYILEYKYAKTGTQGPRITKFDEAGNTEIIFNYDTYQWDKVIAPKEEKKRNRLGWILALASLGLLTLLLVIRYGKKRAGVGH